MDYEQKIAELDAVAQKAKDRAAHLLRIQRAEFEIPTLWDTGEVTQTQLAESYAISAATVKRILRRQGRDTSIRRRLNDEERAQVAALLDQGQPVLSIAQGYQVSKGTIRRVGIEMGVIKPGSRMPRRSDEEYALIEEFDREARKRFGTGLKNLGMGLQSWKHRRNAEAIALAAREHNPSPVANEGVDDTSGNNGEPEDAREEPAVHTTPDFVGDTVNEGVTHSYVHVDTDATIDESAGADPDHPLNAPEVEPDPPTEPRDDDWDRGFTAPAEPQTGDVNF